MTLVIGRRWFDGWTNGVAVNSATSAWFVGGNRREPRCWLRASNGWTGASYSPTRGLARRCTSVGVPLVVTNGRKAWFLLIADAGSVERPIALPRARRWRSRPSSGVLRELRIWRWGQKWPRMVRCGVSANNGHCHESVFEKTVAPRTCKHGFTPSIMYAQNYLDFTKATHDNTPPNENSTHFSLLRYEKLMERDFVK